jgi:uncharacterized membrane protein YhfC
MTISAVILRVINIVLMVGIPVFLAMKLYRRGVSGFRPIWIGAAGFLLSQVGHIPFNQFVMMPILGENGITPGVQSGVSVLILGAAVGLSAGVFEETTRYLILKFWLKKDAGELLPVKYGAGHGGIEAVLAGLLALLALVQVLVLGGEGALAGFDPEQAPLIQSQMETYWAIPWQQALLGAWERISAMSFHIGASILIYKSIHEKNILWYFVALAGHTVLDAYAVIFVSRLDLVLLEAILFVFAAGWLAWAWFIRARDPEGAEADQAPRPETRFRVPQITSQQIEESRYDE